MHCIGPLQQVLALQIGKRGWGRALRAGGVVGFRVPRAGGGHGGVGGKRGGSLEALVSSLFSAGEHYPPGGGGGTQRGPVRRDPWGSYIFSFVTSFFGGGKNRGRG
jgi:hypothetical protein